ncbi:hypothetical protein HNQ62_002639 [Sulfurisphaera ohwakuensis]|uniref:Uncharacterized protein n=1 Tax=Sulfurisphaera ohwakuensis TaxID=69656 RepID=A0A7J9RVS7_SULOH|nr:hypothetical protein [Sulfurisphaera ohwakuensis]
MTLILLLTLNNFSESLGGLFGADADYQALREKVELTKDNSIRELEERRNDILLTATILGIIAIPLVLYFNTYNLINSLVLGIILGLSAGISYAFLVHLLHKNRTSRLSFKNN